MFAMIVKANRHWHLNKKEIDTEIDQSILINFQPPIIHFNRSDWFIQSRLSAHV